MLSCSRAVIAIPVIDLAPTRGQTDRLQVARQIDEACCEIGFFNHPNYDVLIECIAAPGQAKHSPVMSGEYPDLKYVKTGLVPAKAG